MGIEKVVRMLKKYYKDSSQANQLVFIDLEYDGHSGEVFEMATCNAIGDVILDCRIDHAAGTVRKPTTLMGIQAREKCKSHFCADGDLTVHQIAERLKSRGISPKAKFVTWGKNECDVHLSRKMMERGGCFAIFPKEGNCMKPLHTFDHNLARFGFGKPNGYSVTCALENLFPTIFGLGHPLAGKNHQALVDTLQLWLMTMVLVELLEPPSKRTPKWLNKLAKLKAGDGLWQTFMEEYYLPEREASNDANEGGSE